MDKRLTKLLTATELAKIMTGHLLSNENAFRNALTKNTSISNIETTIAYYQDMAIECLNAGDIDTHDICNERALLADGRLRQLQAVL